jgi:hypothetical protein
MMKLDNLIRLMRIDEIDENWRDEMVVQDFRLESLKFEQMTFNEICFASFNSVQPSP